MTVVEHKYQPGDIVQPEGLDGLAEVACQRGRWLWLASPADDDDGDDAPRPFMVRARDVRLVHPAR